LPEFIGGTKALYSYIKKEIHYPEEALENKHTGKVTVSFVVSETGKIREEKIIKGCEECLNIEALRIMQNMPKWNPGQVDGEYVSMQIGIPIFFLIAD
jgi:TonB family protein